MAARDGRNYDPGLKLRCPVCDARPGKSCRRIGTGKRRDEPHAKRVALHRAQGPQPITIKQGGTEKVIRPESFRKKPRRARHATAEASVQRDLAVTRQREAARSAQADLKAQFLARQAAREAEARARRSAAETPGES